eukprot:3978139-Prymnesium_polylepis.1
MSAQMGRRPCGSEEPVLCRSTVMGARVGAPRDPFLDRRSSGEGTLTAATSVSNMMRIPFTCKSR